MSVTLETAADATLDIEATGSFMQSVVFWVLIPSRVSMPRSRSR